MTSICIALEYVPILDLPPYKPDVDCLETLTEVFFSKARELGYSWGSFTCLEFDSFQAGSSVPLFSYNVSSFPVAFCEQYANQLAYEYDPVFVAARRSSSSEPLIFNMWEPEVGPMSESQVDDESGAEDTIRNKMALLVEVARTCGVSSSNFVVFADGLRTNVFAFGTSEPRAEFDKRWDHQHKKDLIGLVYATAQALLLTRGCPRCHPKMMVRCNEIALTEEQKIILRSFLASGDASIKSVAVEVGKSVDTVKYHLKSIRQLVDKPRASGHALALHAAEHFLI